jgi:hypothetical protein
VAYADDGYIKAKLSVALEVLSDVKHVLKEDAGLDLNFDKTKILVKGISAADAHAAAQRMLTVVISRAFFLFSRCNHIINIKKMFFFFRRSKRQRNFSLFFLLHSFINLCSPLALSLRPPIRPYLRNVLN